jgi:hypothetical protein
VCRTKNATKLLGKKLTQLVGGYYRDRPHRRLQYDPMLSFGNETERWKMRVRVAPDLVAVVGDADPARDDMRGLEQPAVAGSAVGEIGTDLRSGRHREKRRSDRPDAGEGRRGEPALGATILEAQRPALHRVRTFKLSNEPKFAEKLKDVVGLYVDPPAHAVVLSVDDALEVKGW